MNEEESRVKSLPDEAAAVFMQQLFEGVEKPKSHTPILSWNDYLDAVDELDALDGERAADPYRKKAVERAMQDDLEKIRRIDSSVGDLTDLGEEFIRLIAAGISADAAYYAVKAAAEQDAPPVIGDISSYEHESGDYLTKEQVDAMDAAQIRKNYQKVRKSMAKWNRN